MLQTKFKTLMYAGNYVDVIWLEKGIYTCLVPFIYSIDDTLESMITRFQSAKDMNESIISDKFLDNLKQCQLVEIELTQTQK